MFALFTAVRTGWIKPSYRLLCVVSSSRLSQWYCSCFAKSTYLACHVKFWRRGWVLHVRAEAQHFLCGIDLDEPPFADVLKDKSVIYLFTRHASWQVRMDRSVCSFLFTDIRFRGLLDGYCSIKGLSSFIFNQSRFIIIPSGSVSTQRCSVEALFFPPVLSVSSCVALVEAFPLCPFQLCARVGKHLGMWEHWVEKGCLFVTSHLFY